MLIGETPIMVVIHVPKAAGTTLRVILERNYPRRVWTVGDDIQGHRSKLGAMSAAEQGRHEVYFGHLTMSWAPLFRTERPVEYLTVLRDPVSRVVSLYYYITRYSTHYLHKTTVGRTFLDWIRSTPETATFDNAMTRQLCGVDDFVRKWTDGVRARSSGRLLSDMRIPVGEVSRGHLEMAMANLDTFGLVGVAERFDEFLDGGRVRYGWRIPKIERQNVTYGRPRDGDVPADVVEAIRERNRLDSELYSYALGLIERGKK